MIHPTETQVGRFCWLDLAATDLGRAKSFYFNVFGWTSQEQLANGGSFTRLRSLGCDVGSVYQLKDVLLQHGMPSHWTPYVRVSNVRDAARRVQFFGGDVVVQPFLVSGVARIALILDSVGALVGLWEPITGGMDVNGTAGQERELQ